jgi:hypothetical protein
VVVVIVVAAASEMVAETLVEAPESEALMVAV